MTTRDHDPSDPYLNAIELGWRHHVPQPAFDDQHYDPGGLDAALHQYGMSLFELFMDETAQNVGFLLREFLGAYLRAASEVNPVRGVRRGPQDVQRDVLRKAFEYLELDPDDFFGNG